MICFFSYSLFVIPFCFALFLFVFDLLISDTVKSYGHVVALLPLYVIFTQLYDVMTSRMCLKISKLTTKMCILTDWLDLTSCPRQD